LRQDWAEAVSREADVPGLLRPMRDHLDGAWDGECPAKANVRNELDQAASLLQQAAASFRQTVDAAYQMEDWQVSYQVWVDG